MNPASPPLDALVSGYLTLHREDDPGSPGHGVFVLRDEQGAEIARTPAFLPEEAPARNALDRLLETLTDGGWQIAQRPNAAFGDAWWDYRFAQEETAEPFDAAMLAEAIASPVAPGLRLGRRRKRRMRQRRAVTRPSGALLVFVLFSLFMLTVTIGFIAVVLWLVSG